MKISLERLYSRDFKIKSTIAELNNNELSMSNDKPISVSYNNEFNVYVVIDGHHRVIEAYLAGKKSIEAERNEYIPSTYDLERDDNKNIIKLIKEEEKLNNAFEKGKDVPLIKNYLEKEAEIKKKSKRRLRM